MTDGIAAASRSDGATKAAVALTDVVVSFRVAVGTYTAKTGDSGKTITIVAVFDGDSTYGASTSGSQTFSVS